ncbi:MAG: hypothetical protein COW02_05690 [Comamonadaceae bacterium CG12_big_fil_rev_8_21_14_0_65_59_15]|nr:MAG: hypothetical protein COW02_05690 [Comamonadaceae bacterium CG12_big_fil_rev_8_21_14_0_65_59_15]
MPSFSSRRFTLKTLAAAVALTTLSAQPAYATDTTRVGILHSLSGTMVLRVTPQIQGRGGQGPRRKINPVWSQ